MPDVKIPTSFNASDPLVTTPGVVETISELVTIAGYTEKVMAVVEQGGAKVLHNV